MSMIGAVALLTEARVESLLVEPRGVYAAVDNAYNDPAAGFVDLDKAWHCLHYLLTGSAHDGEAPLNFLLKGGSPVGEEDLGHGPARAFRPLQVAAIADALSPLDAVSLLRRFDGQKLDRLGIYPGGFGQLNLRSDYELGYYLGPFEGLKKLTARAKAEHSGMLVWIT